MNKLYSNQHIIYKTIENSIKHNRVSHAYLLNGDNSVDLLHYAFSIAKSIACKETIACNECEICKRIDSNNYADLVLLDADLGKIKKNDILDLQDKFSLSSFESSNKKIYIINGIDNITLEAANSLLKFLEEPTRDIHALLITKHINYVLDTIKSRCIHLNFNPESTIIECEDKLDYYIINKLFSNIENIIEDESYQNAIYLFKQTIEILPNFDGVMFLLEEDLFNKKNKDNKKVVNYYLDILQLFINDILNGNTKCSDELYISSFNKLSKFNLLEQYKVILDTKEKTRFNINLNLLIERMLYLMKEKFNEK